MKLIRTPPAPTLIRLVSWIAALVVSGAIVYLVFTFGYFASGLASYKEEQRRRQETPIPLTFSDPNAAPPSADPNAPSR